MSEWDTQRTELEKEREWAIQLRAGTKFIAGTPLERVCDDFITVSASFIGACERIAALEAKNAALRAKVPPPTQSDSQLAGKIVRQSMNGYKNTQDGDGRFVVLYQELLDAATKEIAAHVAPLRARLDEAVACIESIANHPHCSYESRVDSSNLQYSTGVVDGHRCAANIARAFLAEHPRSEAQGTTLPTGDAEKGSGG